MDVREELRIQLGDLVKSIIGTPALEGGGKKQPARLGRSGIRPKPRKDEKEDDSSEETTKSVTVEIAKTNGEQQIITGIVLEPETVDAQGDIYSAEVIEDTAHQFLSVYNRKTRLGLQHKSFKAPGSDGRFSIVESYVAPIEFAMGARTVKAGSWIMSVKVHDATIWKGVKDGKITGFSIGGMSKVQKL